MCVCVCVCVYIKLIKNIYKDFFLYIYTLLHVVVVFPLPSSLEWLYLGILSALLTGHVVVVVVDRFYIALFSALEQTHCARM